MANHPIYLDYQATTPMDERACTAMIPHFTSQFGNPHAQENRNGQRAADAVEKARAEVAALVDADPREVIFTSGATEANNLVLRGAAKRLAAAGRPGIVSSAIEHKSVLAVMEWLREAGHPVTLVPVSEDGIVDPEAVAAAVDDRVGIVSIMTANNEIGTVQPVRELAAIARDAGALFHTDAAQAVGKVPLSFTKDAIDLLSVSAHKLYGPPGIGAAIISRQARRHIEPLFAGGGQELGLRPGTVPAALCVGFGAACAILRADGPGEQERLRRLSALFLSSLDDQGVSYEVNGSLSRRLPGNLNISFAGVDAEALLMTTREDLALSTGSACTSGSLTPSHVLHALRVSDERAESAIRIGFGRPTTEADLLEAAEILARAVERLRSLSYSPRVPVGLAE